MPLTRFIVSVTAVAGLALSACGGGSTAASGTTASSAATSSTPSSAPSTTSTTTAPSTTSTLPAGAVNPNGTEVNPAGDIPDNQVFVSYTPPVGGFTLKVPEGWARTDAGGATTFTDNLNRIRMETIAAPTAPTVQSATLTEVPTIQAASASYEPGTVTSVDRTAGAAILITYRADSPPDAVTGKVVHDDVERYEFWRAGVEVILTLSGPQGADNVDPWRLVTDSFAWV